MSLTAIVSAEFEQVLRQSELTYDTLGYFLRDVTPSKKAPLEREIKRKADKIAAARVKFGELTQTGMLDFSPIPIEALKKAYHHLQQGFPDHADTERISQSVKDNFDNSLISRVYHSVKNLMPLQAAIASVSALASQATGNNIALALYLTAAGTALYVAFSKKESVTLTVLANAGIYFGALALSYFGQLPPETTKGVSMLIGIYALSGISIPCLVRSFQYLLNKKFYNSRIKSIEKARIYLDDFEKAGIAIREAHNSLAFVKSICENRGIPYDEFKPQIERLEKILAAYVHGDTTFDEVVAARIRYIPKQNEAKIMNQPILKRKTGYTPKLKEYQELQKRRPTSGIDIHIKSEEDIQTNAPVTNTPTFQVTFCPRLQQLYSTNERIDGYLMNVVMDATRQKIENYPNIDVIKRDVIKYNGSTRAMLKKIRVDNGLPDNTTISKMQPLGSLRSMYTRIGNEVKVLEIVTHPEYDRMLKAR